MIVNGLGELAGNTPLEELVVTLEVLYGYTTRIKKDEICCISKLVSRLSGVPLLVNKAIVGKMAFTHESGIHSHGVMKEPSTYTSIKPETIGKYSDSAPFKSALNEILKRIEQIGDSGKRLSDTAIITMADAVLAIECKR